MKCTSQFRYIPSHGVSFSASNRGAGDAPPPLEDNWLRVPELQCARVCWGSLCLLLVSVTCLKHEKSGCAHCVLFNHPDQAASIGHSCHSPQNNGQIPSTD